ncbi:MAG: hypothetical protein ABFS35_18875, partial [Bacteroidota bacterium]
TRDAVFIDYNPSKNFFINKYKKHEDTVFLHSTFMDNIQFLTEGIVSKLKSYEPWKPGSYQIVDDEVFYKGQKISAKNQPPPHELNIKNGTADAYLWMVYGLGLLAEKPNRIYKDWKICSDIYFNNLEYKSYFGLDFGISSPTAVVEVKFDGDRTFYIKERLYKPSSYMGMPIYEWLKTKLKITASDLVVADSAKQTMVEDLQLGGLMAVGALKGAGSISRRLTQVQGFNIVYTKSSENLENEYMNYSYKVDRYGLVTDDVEQGDDHLMDSLGYIISYLITYLGIKT